MHNYKKLQKCRLSGSKNLINVCNLGHQVLTGVFPKKKDDPVTRGPLELSWAPESGLLQLGHSYNLREMYGENYGYRSGLNQSMIAHLENKTNYLKHLSNISLGRTVIDIGSNDGTLLNSYKTKNIRRIGIDPTGNKFKNFYAKEITLIPEFFSKEVCKKIIKKNKATIITSIAMFYDLENPRKFVSDIREILEKDGIWHFEQSYMPSMLRMNAYDTICHEHLEYYSLVVVKKLLEEEGLKIVDVQINNVNGGSFAVTASHQNSRYQANESVINWMLGQENRMGLHTPRPYREFEERVFRHREDLRRLILDLNSSGKIIAGYGASTKGNVLLQFCGFTEKDIKCVAEINPDKYKKLTPGTYIPILPEATVRSKNPDYMLVLPWHFRESILRREINYLRSGGRLIFPLPEIEIV